MVLLADLCNVVESSCACALPQGHLNSHACTCGGRWLVEDGDFVGVHAPIAEGLISEPTENSADEDQAGIAEFRRLILSGFGL